MDEPSIQSLRQKLSGSKTVSRLQAASRDLLGGAMLFMARRGDEVIEIHPFSREDDLPEFCQLYRSSPDGLDCCTTCRALMTYGACYRGTLEYSCHGGVRILATPVRRSPDPGIQLVAASCAFARPDAEQGWQEFRDHAAGLGIDLRSLRASYRRMPVLTDEKRRIAFSLIEIAASHISDLQIGATGNASQATPAPPATDTADLDQHLASALYLAQTQTAGPVDPLPGNLLIERIQDMIAREPALPFTLNNIAKAAGITPNHLSAVFSDIAGTTFSDFLLARRIKQAKRLLRDLSLNMDTVARRAGFRNSSYFSRRFRHQTGMSPTQWRNNL